MIREADAVEPPPLRAHARAPLLWSVGFTLFIVAVACAMAASGGHTGVPLIFCGLAFGVLTFPYLLYGCGSYARDVSMWLRNSPMRLVAVAAGCIATYLVYAVGTDCFGWSPFARLTAFVSVPTALCLWSGQRKGLTWQDCLAVFCVWVPFDTGLLNEIWAWPAGEGAYIINTSLAVTLAVTLFGCWRGHAIRFRWQWNKKDVALAAMMFLGFCVIGLPFGFATGFITYNPQLDVGKILGAPLGIFFFIAIPEELLFRGLIQNFLKQLLKNRWAALIVASTFFGATHLNNPPEMDWRFMVLATIAGIFYGLTYEKSKSLLAPALVHAAVDVVWLLLLHV